MPPALAPQALPLRLPGDPNFSSLYRGIADLYGAGQFGEALPLAEYYVAETERAAGNDSLPYANAISLLSRLHQAQGDFDKAEQLLKRSLAIREHESGPDSGDVATELDALAQLYDSQGRFDKAEPLFVRALAITEKNAASDPSSFGRALNDLAWVYQEEGRYAEAEPRIKQALVVLAKAEGTNQSDYGCALDTLAKLYERQNHKNEAEPLYRQALAILESTLGPEHLSVATTRENLGGLLKSQGKLGEAEHLINQALATKEHVFGVDHPNVAKTLSQLGDLYRLQGRQDAADKLFKHAFAISNGAVKEIPVFFATDRERADDTRGIAFSGSRSEELTLGKAMIAVSRPQGATQTSLPAPAQIDATADETGEVPPTPADGIAPLATTTELTHLGMHSDEVLGADQLMRSVALQLGTATHPGEAFVFVHGCCVTFENALYRAAQIAYDIHFDGPTFLFSWPSSGELIDYGEDRETVDLAARHLKEFLEKIVAETKVTKIHFVAHSMGNMVVLQALEKMSNRGSTSNPVIGEVISAAPDVDPDLFKTMVRAIKTQGGNFTLYASRNDWALWTSSKIRNRPRAGYIKDKPLIDAQNFDTIDITQPGSSWFDWFALNHDVYASSPVLVADMQRIIEKHQHPPDVRTKEFESVESKEGTYWLFRRAQAAAVDVGATLPGPSSPTQPALATPPLATVVPPNSTQLPMPSVVTAPPAIASQPSETSTLAPQAEPKATAVPAKLPIEAQVPPLPVAKPPATTSETTASTVKLAHRKKKQGFDPDWNTKPLH